MISDVEFKEINKILTSSIISFWDGKSAILEMKTGGCRQWRQMEWIGFYFQFLCEKNLSSTMKIPGPKYGHVSFDGFYKIPWDFKAHSNNSGWHDIIINDTEAVEEGLKEYGAIGLILASGKAIYNDQDHSFKKWHDELKGGTSAYEFERINRGARSRLRKTAFKLENINIIILTISSMHKFKGFQKGFRNADGSPRRQKVMINLNTLDKEIVQRIRFN